MAVNERENVLGGRYRLEKIIGKGGSGCVYLAVDYALGKSWAVKELSKMDAMLLDEIEILRTLAHPMLPRIVDRIETEDKVYLVMDYLKGVNLRSILQKKKQFSVAQVLQWGIQLCDVLGYLHTHKPPIIYHDMKPGNILLMKNLELCLIDFGCAQFYHDANDRKTITAVTPGFAAPEQCQGVANVQTDIYNLGATIKALCPKNIPPRLQKIIAKCQDENPTKRYQSVAKLERALRRVQRQKRGIANLWKIGLIGPLVLAFLISLGNILGEARSRAYVEAMTRKQYEAAIELFPEEPTPYLNILKDYKYQGKTKAGIIKVESLLNIYTDEQVDKQLLDITIGKLYFTGNIFDESFGVDYEQAYKYFMQVDINVHPDVDWYQQMAKKLCDFGTEIDWQQMRDDLKQMEAACAMMSNDEEKIAGYQATAAVYLANHYYLADEQSNPTAEAIRLLETARELLQVSTTVPIKDILLTDVNLRIAKGYTLAGLQTDNQQLLNESYALYEQVLITQEQLEVRLEIMQKLAYIRRCLTDYQGAARWYEAAIVEATDDVEIRCQYILMKLLEEKDIEMAKALFIEVENIPGSEQNNNYQIIKTRLETIS